MDFKTIFNYKPSEGIINDEPSLTQSQYLEECDINFIMARYLRTGVLSDPLSLSRPMSYGDFSNLGDYQSNLNKVIEARDRFMLLPSKVREAFHNNPAEMISFVLDPSNKDKAISLGLLDASDYVSPSVPVAPAAVPVAPAAVSVASAVVSPSSTAAVPAGNAPLST